MGHAGLRGARLLVLTALAAVASGCFTLARTEAGSVPSSEAVAAIREGAALEAVVARLGPPLQMVDQADGLLLVYRERATVWRRIGIQPGLLLQLVDLSGVIGAAAANLSFVYEWGHVSERRLVVLFDEDERVETVAYRGRAGG